MKIKLIAAFLFILISLQVKAQPITSSIGIGTGILNLRGNALGVTVLFDQKLSDNLFFTFVPGIYSWINSKDMNGNPFEEPPINHTKVYAKYLIPVRFGLRYNFGSSPSHPFGIAELGFNLIGKEEQVPILSYLGTTLSNISYRTNKGSYIYVSMGFAAGYTFRLRDGLNLDVAVVSHYGDNRQYVNLMSAVKFDL